MEYVTNQTTYTLAGRPLPEDAPLLNRGLWFGEGVFETLRCYDGCPFRWEAHYRRLSESARSLALPAPTAGEFLESVLTALSRAGLRDARVRVSLFSTGDLTPREARRGYDLVVQVQPAETEPRPPISLGVVSVRRSPACVLSPRVKTSAVWPLMEARGQAARKHCDEALILSEQGYVAEAPSANVFLVEGGRLRTPHLSCGLLKGVTRDLVLELSAAYVSPVEETYLTPYDLYVADEVFLCNSTQEIQPVASVDGRQLPRPVPGPVTKKLQQALKESIAREVSRWRQEAP